MKPPLKNRLALLHKVPAFDCKDHTGAHIRITTGQVTRLERTETILALAVIGKTHDQANPLNRGLSAAGGAALGMLLSPIGAAIGAAAGAAFARGRELITIQITTTSPAPILITIRPSDIGALERAACHMMPK